MSAKLLITTLALGTWMPHPTPLSISKPASGSYPPVADVQRANLKTRQSDSALMSEEPKRVKDGDRGGSEQCLPGKQPGLLRASWGLVVSL